MPLRLILGRAGSGKTSLCYEEISSRLKENPKGEPLLYIVPEQATFQAEYSIATLPGIKGSFRAQVVSFRRLAFKVLQELGGGGGTYIDDVGKAMVLRKILERKKLDLKVFKYSSRHSGMLENIVETYNELKRSGVSVAKLTEALSFQEDEKQGKRKNSYLKEKINDLSLILKVMEEELSGTYIDEQDYLDLLIEKIPQSSYLREAEIWVDGFYEINSQEMAVLRELLKKCPHVNVTLCLNRDYQPYERLEELDPFFPAASSCQRLKQEALSANISFEVQLLSEVSSRFNPGSKLAHLEKYFHKYPPRLFKEEISTEEIRLVATAHRRCEVESLAREITSLARDKGYRWRDMVVMAGDLDQYRDTLATVFKDFDIPFFFDHKRSVLHHPIIEFLRSALEVVTHNWRYDAVFRCAKTDILLPPGVVDNKANYWRERLDRLENYALAFGISGNRWLKDEDWDYRKGDSLEEYGEEKNSQREERFLKEINETRRQISTPLITFQKRIKKAPTLREKTESLYFLLEDAGAQGSLENWHKEALERGETEKAREHFQVYKLILDLMDQLVEIMGEEKVPLYLFVQLLEAGMERLRLSLVPPALDQVLVGTPDRTRPGNVKGAFIIGVNDGVFPACPQEDSIFSEEEREVLNKGGLNIIPGSRQLFDEQYISYMALTRPSELLWVSYPLADEEGKGLMPSLLISRLKEIFPTVKEENLGSQPKPEEPEEEAICYISHPRRTLSHLSVQLSRWNKEGKINTIWWDVYNWFASREEWQEKGKLLMGGVFYENKEENLQKATCSKLYGVHMKSSVSRIEKYKQCPFSHFISYGLRLKERPVYRLDHADTGRFFHAALYEVGKALESKGLEWKDLSPEDTGALVEEEVNKLIPLLQKEILLSSSRYRFLGKNLKKTVQQASLILREQSLVSSFKPIGLEIAFGEGENLPGFTFSLANGCRVELKGRIDRIDGARGADGKYYLRVVDYKSGLKDVNLSEIYHGLSLQLLAYLDVALTYAKEWLKEEALPAGILYFRIHSDLLKVDNPLSPEAAKVKLRGKYKMKGRVLGNLEVVKLMDSSLIEGKTSAIVPVGIKKDGQFNQHSKVLDALDFSFLRKHVEKTIVESTAEITGGNLQISPYRLAKNKACSYCENKPVCQFDPLITGYEFRVLQQKNEKDILNLVKSATKIKKEGKKNE